MSQMNKNSLTLLECQEHVAEMMADRNWDKRDILLQTVMMAEEMGEVAKAIREITLKGGTKENIKELSHELADVFNYTCHLATFYNIDLNTAFVDKININKQREW